MTSAALKKIRRNAISNVSGEMPILGTLLHTGCTFRGSSGRHRGIAREGLELVCDRIIVTRKPSEFAEDFNASGSEFFTCVGLFVCDELDAFCVRRR